MAYPGSTRMCWRRSKTSWFQLSSAPAAIHQWYQLLLWRGINSTQQNAKRSTQEQWRHQDRLSQTSLTIIQLALQTLWRKTGVSCLELSDCGTREHLGEPGDITPKSNTLIQLAIQTHWGSKQVFTAISWVTVTRVCLGEPVEEDCLWWFGQCCND